MLKHLDITLAILAGGKATRMQGTNKALLKHNGVTFIEHIIGNLSDRFSETIIVSNDNEIDQVIQYPIYKDIINDRGPLGGIHSALTNASNQLVFIVSCDMPFANAEILDKIIEQANIDNYEAVVPIYIDRMEPLFALYSANTIVKLTEVLHGNKLSVKGFLEKINTNYIKLSAAEEYNKCFTNINTLEEYYKYV